jgi:hypothetical protein
MYIEIEIPIRKVSSFEVKHITVAVERSEQVLQWMVD